jgi:hypothetical protein
VIDDTKLWNAETENDALIVIDQMFAAFLKVVGKVNLKTHKRIVDSWNRTAKHHYKVRAELGGDDES